MNHLFSNFLKTRAGNFSAALRTLFSLAICLPVLAAAAFAAPPNDNFSSAQVISGFSGVVTGTNVGSTKEAGELPHALNRGGGSVWYKYVAPGNGALKITTENSSFNTLLAVYQGTALNNLKLIAANDDIQEGNVFSIMSSVRIGTKINETYYIVVDGRNNNDAGGTAAGNISLSFSLDNVAPNDNFANAISLPFENGKMKVTTNVGASKELSEPNHALNAGGKSVWYKWKAPSGPQKTFFFTVNSLNLAGSYGVATLLAVYTGSSVDALSDIGFDNSNGHSKIVFKPVPDTTYYIAIDGRDSGSGADTGTFMFSYGVYKTDKVADFDGDGKADPAVFRPTTGLWYSLDSITGQLRAFQWGSNGDKPLIADKNGDGKTDLTVFRPDTGTWYIDPSDSLTFEIFNWGLSNDIPMYRRRFSQYGLNNAFPTVFRPSTGVWYQYVGNSNPIITHWGQSGDIPVLADFTGDGVDDLTVFRPSTGVWYVLINAFTNEFQAVQFGQSGDKPVPADYDGDGRADIAVYRPSNGVWYVLRSSDLTYQIAQFGLANDKPQPADFDGDSKDDFAVYRNGTWWILQSSDGQARTVQFGLSSDIPVTAPAN